MILSCAVHLEDPTHLRQRILCDTTPSLRHGKLYIKFTALVIWISFLVLIINKYLVCYLHRYNFNIENNLSKQEMALYYLLFTLNVIINYPNST